MFTVYRLEGPDGTGPYNDSTPHSRIIGNEHGVQTHPGPYQDFGRHPHMDEYFGCETLTQLMIWFGEYFTNLLAEGFRVVKYDVPDGQVMIGLSGMQVMFSRGDTISETVPIQL